MKRFFGTDGVRGIANDKLTPEFALALGSAVGRFIQARGWAPSVVIGRDTRRSGPMLGAAFAAGLCAEGIDVTALGVVPTGGVSYVVRSGSHSIGAVISASHNPAPDNGIKLFAGDGRKIEDEAEVAIESFLDSSANRKTGEGVGYLENDRSALGGYRDMLVSLVPEGLSGMKVALDAAHGSAYELGVEVLRALGATVFSTGCDPNGMNINAEGGATKPGNIAEFTQNSQAEVGVAFDGDADRAVFCDEKGRLINGDRTMAIWAAFWKEQGKLSPAKVVGTVMSNGGFAQHLADQGIELIRAAVGDKYVSEAMTAHGAKIGGEQSGHLIFMDLGPTGDGLITMLEFLRVLRLMGQPASALYEAFENWPQVLLNLELPERDGWSANPTVGSVLKEAEAVLANDGRLNVRPSGTMPMVRVMVEAREEAKRDRVAEMIFRAMETEAGARLHSRVDLTHALGD